MDASLIKPPPSDILLVGINGRYSHSCLALFYLRQALKRHLPDCPTRMLQLTINDPYHETLLRIAEGKPWAIFLSAVIWNSEIVTHLARDLRALLPRTRLLVGGPQAAVARRQLPDAVCAVFHGAIEGAPTALYQDVRSGNLAASYQAAGLAASRADFPFPYVQADFAAELLNRHVYYESSRGCPHACAYCLSARERGVFHKDLSTVFHELRIILENNPKELRFVDRTFNAIPDRALAIWRFLAEHGATTRIHCEIAPEGFSEEMFDFLAAQPPARFQFEIGIQSTNGQTLSAINRGMDSRAALETTRRLAQLGTVFLHADLILGLPHETRQSYLAGFAALFASGAHYIQMGLLKILPETPLAARAEEYGMVYSQRPPYGVLATRWLDADNLAELYWFGECVEKFHNNAFFPSLWRYLRQSKADAAAFFLDLTALFQRRQGFQRAATQEFLTATLAEFLAKRPDAALVFDLLRYDWLRSGQRRLPECLALPAERESLAASHDQAYRLLPPFLDGLYQAKERNAFCRRLVCLRPSDECLAWLGYGAMGRICMLAEREAGLFARQKTLFLPDDGDCRFFIFRPVRRRSVCTSWPAS
jgi:radical SAM superfamily enzyme YgiQ (UPF0313 family)